MLRISRCPNICGSEAQAQEQPQIISTDIYEQAGYQRINNDNDLIINRRLFNSNQPDCPVKIYISMPITSSVLL